MPAVSHIYQFPGLKVAGGICIYIHFYAHSAGAGFPSENGLLFLEQIFKE